MEWGGRLTVGEKLLKKLGYVYTVTDDYCTNLLGTNFYRGNFLDFLSFAIFY